jgi:hypothetical protein
VLLTDPWLRFLKLSVTYLFLYSQKGAHMMSNAHVRSHREISNPTRSLIDLQDGTRSWRRNMLAVITFLRLKGVKEGKKRTVRAARQDTKLRHTRARH